MNAKEQFISNKPLSDWWSNIANDSKFDMVLLHASAVAFEACPSTEQRDGILKFKDLLLTLSQPDAQPVSFSQPGLNHNLEPKPRTLKPTEKKK